ncbi:protein O-mannosyl-transferase TMTC4-like isoform X1 [Hylaeus volcanicus]|uniref:protein O-mannosyl-transferase TMTC4-like isoform X1 n=1 Tax=Hylaeus volcanicus TaxID=313075 RepID=UPI0023B83202|nr:protein O-mannosyl-transferase TMTC4-like isoform X1 [Hylaeus volcanicus]
MLPKTDVSLPGRLLYLCYNEVQIINRINTLINNFVLSDVPLPFSLLIITLLSLCFANSYNGDFVFDDSEAIINNEDVQTNPLKDLFKNDFWGTKLTYKQSHRSYRPLTILTFRLQFWLRETFVAQDYHIVNIILHTLVCILLLPVFNIILGSKEKNIAVYATILFAVHPVHTEAVSGIVGRAELLCALFMWLSILLYNYSIYGTRLLCRWCSMCGCIISIGISMLCKETGITAIGICSIYDLVVVNKVLPSDVITFLTIQFSYTKIKNIIMQKRKLLIRLFILFLSGLILVISRFSVMGFKPPTFQPVDNPASFLDNIFLRMMNYSYIYCLNAWLLICPQWLCFDWSMGCVPLITTYDIRILYVLIFWLIIGLLFTYAFNPHEDKSVRYTIMGLAILVIPFLPASNIFFNVGFVLAERTLYIPSAGYCLLFVIGLHKLCNRISMQYALLAYTILISLFFTRSWMRSDQWKTETSLFRSALLVCPLNAKVHYNIAKNAADAGNSTLAQYAYEEALRLNPKYAQAMNNLGNLLKDQEKYLEAESLFKRAIELQEDFATAWMNLGIVLSALKKYKESEKSYLTALSHRTKYPDCLYNLGVLYLEQRNYDKALKAWEAATRQRRTHRRAWTNMILLLDDLGMREDALKTATQALQFLPDNASIHFNIANILGKAGNFVAAEMHFKIAISKNPTDSMFFTNLGVLYHRWNKLNEAEYMYKKALEIKPELHSARDNLKKLYSLKSSIK